MDGHDDAVRDHDQTILFRKKLEWINATQMRPSMGGRRVPFEVAATLQVKKRDRGFRFVSVANGGAKECYTLPLAVAYLEQLCLSFYSDSAVVSPVERVTDAAAAVTGTISAAAPRDVADTLPVEQMAHGRQSPPHADAAVNDPCELTEVQSQRDSLLAENIALRSQLDDMRKQLLAALDKLHATKNEMEENRKSSLAAHKELVLANAAAMTKARANAQKALDDLRSEGQQALDNARSEAAATASRIRTDLVLMCAEKTDEARKEGYDEGFAHAKAKLEKKREETRVLWRDVEDLSQQLKEAKAARRNAELERAEALRANVAAAAAAPVAAAPVAAAHVAAPQLMPSASEGTAGAAVASAAANVLDLAMAATFENINGILTPTRMMLTVYRDLYVKSRIYIPQNIAPFAPSISFTTRRTWTVVMRAMQRIMKLPPPNTVMLGAYGVHSPDGADFRAVNTSMFEEDKDACQVFVTDTCRSLSATGQEKYYRYVFVPWFLVAHFVQHLFAFSVHSPKLTNGRYTPMLITMCANHDALTNW
jgi:hypothetical protein